METTAVVRRFKGQKQGEFVIRSTFGGAAENFIVSGSEGEFLRHEHIENGANSFQTPRSTSGTRKTEVSLRLWMVTSQAV